MSDYVKNALRATIKKVRTRISAPYRIKASQQVCNRIRTLSQYRQAKRIALYHAANGEIDLSSLWDSAPMQGKFCYFPAIQPNFTLLFLPATPTTPFKKNQFGIAEPDVSHDLALPINELDILFIPLVAFDSHCTRIGMGLGYYDRTLAAQTQTLLLGTAYSFQHVDFIHPQPWDIALNGVITPKTIYWRKFQE